MNKLNKLNKYEDSTNWTPNSNLDATGVKVKRNGNYSNTGSGLSGSGSDK